MMTLLPPTPRRFAREHTTLPADVCLDEDDVSGGANEDDKDPQWTAYGSLNKETRRFTGEPKTSVEGLARSLRRSISKARTMRFLQSTDTPKKKSCSRERWEIETLFEDDESLRNMQCSKLLQFFRNVNLLFLREKIVVRLFL